MNIVGRTKVKQYLEGERQHLIQLEQINSKEKDELLGKIREIDQTVLNIRLDIKEIEQLLTLYPPTE